MKDCFYFSKKDKAIDYGIRRRYSNPLLKREASIRSSIHKGMFKTGRWSERIQNIIGCQPSFYRDFLTSLFTSNMSWDNYGEWEIDHIVSLKNATTELEQDRLFHYTNTRPLWKHENRPS